MYNVLYHDGNGLRNVQECNVRIDVTENKYILRACRIVLDGNVHEITVDTWWPHFADHMKGVILSGSDGTTKLMVVDPAWLEGFNWESVRSTVGTRIFNLFDTISGITDNSNIVQSIPYHLGVTRAIVAGDTPAEKSPLPAKESHLVKALSVDDNPLTAKAKADYEARLASPPKKWEDMTSDERDAVMRKVAEQMGLILRT